jgi:tetratricopeptide (TPR) repeat protein
MATAPLVVLLFDRTFLAGSFREAFRKRASVYAALACTWLLLGFLVLHNPGRAGSVGFASAISWNDYAFTQIGAVVHYLQLAFWPNPLVFDYGTSVVHRLTSVWPQAVLLAVLTSASLWGLVRNRPWGFLGCAFFLLLAPSSSVIPVATQTIAEHRMYLALAPLCVFSVLALHRLISTKAYWIAGAFALAAGVVTSARNQDYRSPLALWQDTVEKRPENPRAQLNAGVQLAETGQSELALPRFREAVRLAPNDSDARNNFANALKTAAQWDEAIQQYAEAIRLGPRNGKARLNFGRSLAARARWQEAREQFAEVAKIVALNQLAEAEKEFRAALVIDPTSAPALAGLGEIFARTQRLAEAETTLQQALKRDPNSVAAHNHLGNVYLLTRRPADALAEFQAALQLTPTSGITYFNMGIALVALHRREEAEKAFEQAARLDPGNQRVKEILTRLKSSPR